MWKILPFLINRQLWSIIMFILLTDLKLYIILKERLGYVPKILISRQQVYVNSYVVKTHDKGFIT